MRLNAQTLMLTAITSIVTSLSCQAQSEAFSYPDSDYRIIQKGKTIPSSFLTDFTYQAFGGVDHFRGIPDSDYGDNNGLIVGLQGAAPLPYLGSSGIGFQAGASYGAYDFAGRGFTNKNKKDIQSQGFTTFGLFKRAMPCSPWSVGIAYDIMFNQHFSIYSESPTLTQWRTQLACFFGDYDELGLWASWSGSTSHKTYRYYTVCDHKLSYKAVSQCNFFWRHIFQNNTETSVWVGVPFVKRLNRKLSEYPAKYIVGGKISVPFGDSWDITGRAQYAQPPTKKGPQGSRDYGCNIAIEIGYNFGGNSTKAPAVAPWNPYLSLANNSNFMVDAKSQTKIR